MFHCQPSNPLSEIEKRWKPIVEIAPKCPRCASSNTKFCYYNNYSLSQPRYFCKGCRRYWTKGGSLRNVPVGGGCRKNRRSKASAKLCSLPTSSTHSRDSNELSEISNCDSASQPGSDIDLAVVFANFLNQNPTRVEADLVCEKVSDEASANSITFHQGSSASNYSVQDKTPTEANLVQEFAPFEEEKREEANMGNEIGEFGLQGLLGDHPAGQDVFWSEAPASFSWQPMAHLQDMEAFPSSMNPVNDNMWSSFDFSGFEIFSRS